MMVYVTCVLYGTLLIIFPSLGTIQNESWKFYSYRIVAKTKDKSIIQREMTSPNVPWPFRDFRDLVFSIKAVDNKRPV